MVDKNQESSESCEDQVKKRIDEQFVESGLYGYWQENNPELFKVLELQVLPRLRDYLLFKCEIKQKEKELDSLDERLIKVAAYAKGKEATLRVWERNVGWVYWLNNGFDWLLKAGLTIVPILSLFSIANLTVNSAFIDSKSSFLVGVILFISISLVWLTSATIYNLIISENEKGEENKQIQDSNSSDEMSFFFKWKNDEKFKFSMSPISISRKAKFFWMMFLIWLSEGLLGWAVIPPLIEIGRKQTAGADTAATYVPLGIVEKFEILVGIAIFAFINILFSVAKGRVYKWNSQRRVRYAQAFARWNGLKQKRAELVKKIAKLEEKIKELEPKIYPDYEMEYIRTQNQILSNEVNSGYDYRGKNPAKYGIKKGNQSEKAQKPPDSNDGKNQKNKDNDKSNEKPSSQNENATQGNSGESLNGVKPENSTVQKGEVKENKKNNAGEESGVQNNEINKPKDDGSISTPIPEISEVTTENEVK